MRITGGAARGIPLATGRARTVRPATDRMREAVFSSLGEAAAGAHFLDLFAGTGAYGLEALSRGARSGCFVERDSHAVEAIRLNLAKVARSAGLADTGAFPVFRKDALSFAVPEGTTLVFLDPPYELTRSQGQRLLERILREAGPGCSVVLELPGDLALAHPGWTCWKRLGGRGADSPGVLLLEKDPD